MLGRKTNNWLNALGRACLSFLLAGLLVSAFFPLAAFADDDNSQSSTDTESTNPEEEEEEEEESPFNLFPLISSPELLKNLIDSNETNLNDSASKKTFDYQGTYDGQLVVADNYEQMYNLARAALAPNVTVALAKEAGTLLLADSTLVKMGNASSIEEAVAYGINAVLTAVGQSSLVLTINCGLQSEAVAAPALAAMDRALIMAHNISVKTTGLYSSALQAAYGGTILANEITAEISGENSPAVYVGAGEGFISLANSTLSTSAINSPLASSDGRIEMDNVAGVTDATQLAWVHDDGALLVHGSRLESGMTERDDDDPEANAIALYREDPVNLETLQENTIFQATDSALLSSLKSGSLFYLTNTRAKIYLENTSLDFDENSVRLLTAVGNNRTGWGTQGSNGAAATVTAQNQKLKGDVMVDSQSSVDLFLLNGSTWRGGALSLSGSQNTLISDRLNVTIDRNSAWVVTKKSTVTNLNLANGARLIDPYGKSVKIVDSNGFTLVDGASDISVMVTGGFSTTVRTTADNEPESYIIDRTSLDEAFGLDTAYGSNASSVYSTNGLQTLEVANRIKNWFREL